MKLDRTDITLAGLAAVMAAFSLVSKYGQEGTFHDIVIVMGSIGWSLFAGKMFLLAAFGRDE